jgi:hypothetical protein
MPEKGWLWKGLGFVLSLVVTALGTAFIKDRWDAARLVVDVVDVRIDPRSPATFDMYAPPPPAPAPPLADPYTPAYKQLQRNSLSSILLSRNADARGLCARENALTVFIDGLRAEVKKTADRSRNEVRRGFLETFYVTADDKQTNDLYDVLYQLSIEDKFPRAYYLKPKDKYPETITLSNGFTFSFGDPPPSASPEPAVRVVGTQAETRVRRWMGVAAPADMEAVLLLAEDSLKDAAKQCATVKFDDASPIASAQEQSLVATVLVSNHGRDSDALRCLGLLELTIPAGQGHPARPLLVNMESVAGAGDDIRIVRGLESVELTLRSSKPLSQVVKEQQTVDSETPDQLTERLKQTLKNAEGSVTAKVRVAKADKQTSIASKEEPAVGGNGIRKVFETLRAAK